MPESKTLSAWAKSSLRIASLSVFRAAIFFSSSPGPEGRKPSGPIRPEWRKLFEDFPDRFVIGTDQHYPQPEKGPQRWQAVVLLFNQLPADLRQKIGIDNPTRIYNLK